MSIDTINYLLSKYYESLTSLQYLYQEELEELKKNLINKKQDKKLKYVNKRKVRNEKR